jgi:hypothetical protein
LFVTDFHRREGGLKNDLKNTKERVWSLDVNLREAEAGVDELKRVMKEKQARRDLEVLEVASKSM